MSSASKVCGELGGVTMKSRVKSLPPDLQRAGGGGKMNAQTGYREREDDNHGAFKSG